MGPRGLAALAILAFLPAVAPSRTASKTRGAIVDRATASAAAGIASSKAAVSLQGVVAAADAAAAAAAGGAFSAGTCRAFSAYM